MELLRFITAGSVDDGKSTLIGRLLYDSKNILADQLEAIHRASKTSADNVPDLALLTDGLRAEREQGITIDVAYKYFSTPQRKFIIADAPGHVQYTRNLVTAASGTDLIILLIDARLGVVEQTRRHSLIASILGIPNIVIAINKLDLLGYSREAYDNIVANYEEVAKQLGLKERTYIPISALFGDNIVERSEAISWYKGPSVLEYLETVPIQTNEDTEARSRFFVQYVIRPQTPDLHDYRGYAGRVLCGEYKVGEEVIIYPSKTKSFIHSIEFNLAKVTSASEGQSVILHLKDDIDVSRGDLIVTTGSQQPTLSNVQFALICWLDEKPLIVGNRYTLQQQTRKVTAMVKEVVYRLDVHKLEAIPATEAKLNEIVLVRLQTASPLAYDNYSSLRANGSFILIDETSNQTAGGGLFQELLNV